MPEKDPSFWVALWAAFYQSATWQGAIMAGFIAVLRVLYDGKETRPLRIGLEALICGGLSLAGSNALSFLGAPEALGITIGGAIGFLGVTTIREFLLRWTIKKID